MFADFTVFINTVRDNPFGQHNNWISSFSASLLLDWDSLSAPDTTSCQSNQYFWDHSFSCISVILIWCMYLLMQHLDILTKSLEGKTWSFFRSKPKILPSYQEIIFELSTHNDGHLKFTFLQFNVHLLTW